MSDLIKIKGGTGDVPKLQSRELGYSKDKKALFIGTADGNVKLCDAGQEDRIKTLEDKNVITQGEFNAFVETLNLRFETINSTLETIKSRLDALESSLE